MERESARNNLNLLDERIRLMLETNAAKELYNYLKDLSNKYEKNKLNIIVTGSGGSYPAAFFQDMFYQLM